MWPEVLKIGGVGFKNTWGVGLVERGLSQWVGGKRQAIKTGIGDWSSKHKNRGRLRPLPHTSCSHQHVHYLEIVSLAHEELKISLK